MGRPARGPRLPPLWRELLEVRSRMTRPRTREIALLAAPARRALEHLGPLLRRRA